MSRVCAYEGGRCGWCKYGEDPDDGFEAKFRSKYTTGKEIKQDEDAVPDRFSPTQNEGNGNHEQEEAENEDSYHPSEEESDPEDPEGNDPEVSESSGSDAESNNDAEKNDGDIQAADHSASDLRTICEEMGISKCGNKASLAKRINQEKTRLASMGESVDEELKKKEARKKKKLTAEMKMQRRELILKKVIQRGCIILDKYLFLSFLPIAIMHTHVYIYVCFIDSSCIPCRQQNSEHWQRLTGSNS